jgi:alkane 1-monooxygenase
MKAQSRNALYFLSLTPAIAVIGGNLLGEYFSLLNTVYSLIFLAIVELVTKPITANQAGNKTDYMPLVVLYLHVPFQLMAIGSLFWAIANKTLTDIWIFVAAISTGINSGSSAIVVAHEFIHQKNTIKKLAGKLLLFTAGNPYFFIDHLLVHHKWVATPKDHASARFGENLYAFFVRSVIGQLKGAFLLEANRLKKRHQLPVGLMNYVVRQLFLQLLLMAVLFYFIGGIAVFAWVIQVITANFLLEYVNYLQHYGLSRPEKSRVTEAHSWDTDQFVSRFVLVDLARHADHHCHASKPYHTLQHYKQSPKLPGGYASLFFVAAIPPLWFKIVNPKIKLRNHSH